MFSGLTAGFFGKILDKIEVVRLVQSSFGHGGHGERIILTVLNPVGFYKIEKQT
jgi:hypothetical protein